jgi:hypothetical protein
MKGLNMADGFEIDIEKELAAFEAQERARLGLDEKREQWTDSMVNAFFSAKERPTTTILNGGLTMAHDEFVAQGYRVQNAFARVRRRRGTSVR